MSNLESLTQPEAATAIARGDREAALAWLEIVGSWPSSDRDVQATTDAASRLLGFPVASDRGPSVRGRTHTRCGDCDSVYHNENDGELCPHMPKPIDHTAEITAAMESGRFRIHRQGTITDALGTRERLCVTSKLAGGEIAGYVLWDHADHWVRDTPCYNPWPELDRVVESEAGITIGTHAASQSRAHTAAAFRPGDRVVDRVNGKAGRVLGSQPPAVAGWPRSYTIAWEDGTEGGGWYDEDLDGGAS